MRTWLWRCAGFLGARWRDRELDDEVALHLELLTEDYMRRGLGADAARAEARRHFGGVIQMKERYREQRGLPLIETLWQDTRYGVRQLLRYKGFTAAALVTLALGIGANSAIFSVVHAVLLRPLDYPEPDRIVQMHRNDGGLWEGLDARRYMFWRDHMRSVEALAAWRATAFNVVAGDSAEYIEALQVSKEYFQVFGGVPLHGRVFEPNEDLENGPPVTILGHEIWRRMFGEDPSVIGRSVSLGDRSYQIIGVMAPGFDAQRRQELYVPLRPGPRGPGSGFNYRVAGRLRAGVTKAQADAESAALFEAYTATLPTGTSTEERGPLFIPYQEALGTSVRPALLVMLGAVGLLLLIACANTANLLLARASGRGREIAVRAALGASHSRIVAQLLTESVVLFVAGGLLAVVLAYWAVPALLAMTPPGFLPFTGVRVDAAVVLITLGVSVVTGLIFGLAPALSLSRRALAEAFKDDGTRTTGNRRTGWLRQGLVVAEVALCMLLLVGAGLLVQTFLKLRAVDPGFDTRNVLTARMSLLGERYGSSAQVNQLFDRGLDRLRRIPGVEAAAVVSGVPIEQGLNLNFDYLETPKVEVELTDWRYATPDYFRAMGIQVVKGRGLQETDDAGAPRVAVVSERFEQRLMKGRAIGRRIQIFSADGPIEIVGVVRDLSGPNLGRVGPPVMYVPVAQASDAAVKTSHQYFQVSWVVKAASLSADLGHRLREELRAVAPWQPVTLTRSMDDVKARAMQIETFQMTLLSTFAALGLLLAAAGIYGLLAYSVVQRTREFGIRMALGAPRHSILRSVVRLGAALALVGVIIGGGAAIWLTRTLESFLFDVSTLDVPTFVGVGVLLVAVAAVASLVPALRAIRLNPVAALRDS